MAWPLGKMVLTKMPMLPFGESLPPTTLKPRPFLPGPFSNAMVCRLYWCADADRAGRAVPPPPVRLPPVAMPAAQDLVDCTSSSYPFDFVLVVVESLEK